ncbi:unnamed protein product [Closterium sp. Naga37s-1]|nr:unnamed protein product [Closterium sp. Naga37s-1]
MNVKKTSLAVVMPSPCLHQHRPFLSSSLLCIFGVLILVVLTGRALTAETAKGFGVLILVVLTGRALTAEAEAGSMHILPWHGRPRGRAAAPLSPRNYSSPGPSLQVDECLSRGDVAGLKIAASMDTPDDVLLRISHLALTCTVARTASRPTMGGVANELQAVRNEVGGKEEVRAAVKVDEEDEERNNVVKKQSSLTEELNLIGFRA